MPAVNRERKQNSNPMGKRKHWYVPCIAPALAALLLAGCGAQKETSAGSGNVIKVG
mgnify:FL=1